MNEQYRMVRGVHKKFGSPFADSPQILSGAGEQINKRWAEYFVMFSDEMKVESKAGCGGQLLKRSSWIVEETGELLRAETIEDQADALTDILYFVLGSFVEIGVKPEKLFNIVNNANLAKLWEDGKPRFDEQGKWIKPPTWAPPEPQIEREIKEQILISKLPWE